MNKLTNKSGLPLAKQIINFILRPEINRTASAHNSDKYTKKFTTYDHLIVMMLSVITGCGSLRDLENIALGSGGKLNHLGLNYLPKRSTISDANKKRSSKVFASIYYSLLKGYRVFLSDSSKKDRSFRNLSIVDSSTISLFSDVLKGTGRNPVNGQKKGGIKMHTMINSLEDVPNLVRFTCASTHDHIFLQNLELKRGSFVVFDKGYNDYQQYHQWSIDGVYFVTRQKTNAIYKSLAEFDLDHKQVDDCILKEEIIEQEHNGIKFNLRRIAFYHAKQKKVYEFITNNYAETPEKIADIYKERWSIELLFKRLKQNFPLKYFLGDSQNAIEIQIWTSLIVQLIMLVIKAKVKRKWAFSNMINIIKFQLMSYIDLFKFLENPAGTWEQVNNIPQNNLQLFSG